MSEAKPGPRNAADDLLKTSPDAAIELDEGALDAVAGGETVAKQKAQQKAAAAINAYIAG